MTARLPLPSRSPRLRLRLTAPAEIVAAVPYLLGFHPSESLVALGLVGPRSQIGLTMRLDLPPALPRRVLLSEVARRLVRAGASSAVLIAYCERSEDGPVEALARATARRLSGEGVAVRDALLVRQGRWRSWLCGDPRCCPPAGAPVPGTADPDGARIAAAAALAGRGALASREDVLRGLAPPAPALAATVARRIEQAEEESGQWPDAETGERLSAEIAAIVPEALARYAHPRAALGPDEAARLVIALSNGAARDELVRAGCGPDGDRVRRMLTDLVRLAPPPRDADAAAALAWVVYQQGDGVAARALLDRALDSDPGHGLARLLDAAWHEGVPPSALRELLVSAGESVTGSTPTGRICDGPRGRGRP